MNIELIKPFAANSAVDEFDVRQMKKALNRLGYYRPYEKTGITGIPDTGVFDALRAFQKDHGLPPTGEARPDDETVARLGSISTQKNSGKYIWRTVGDDKVRDAHAALNGTVRDFADSPDPGEEFNCRCWAEPVVQAVGLSQTVISPINDARKKWSTIDFVNHFYRGRGRTVSLSEIGLFSDIIEHARSIIFKRVESQIEQLAQSVVNGELKDTFARSYYFGSVSFSLGNSTVSGNITGRVKKQDQILLIDAKVEYLFFDQFTDPLNIRENRENGTSASDQADPGTELFGTAYDIVGRWLTEVTGTVKVHN